MTAEWLLLVLRCRPEKEFSVNIGDALVNHFPHACAGTPPMFRVIIGVVGGNDANLDARPQRLLKEQPGAARVGVFREHIDGGHLRIVFTKPFAEGDSAIIGPIPSPQNARERLSQLQPACRLSSGSRRFDKHPCHRWNWNYPCLPPGRPWSKPDHNRLL